MIDFSSHGEFLVQPLGIFKKHSNSLAHICLGFILIFYASVQIRHFTTGYQEPDPDGYLVLAKRFATFGPMAVKDDDMFIHHSHVWVENSRGEVIPKFSPGYPLLMAIFYRIGGDDAMFIVSPLCGGLAIIGAYLLFYLWMSRAAALMAAASLATNAMMLIYSGYLLTHAANLCFITWGMFFLWKWVREGNLRYGAPAGLLLGYAAVIRHTSLLIGLVVLAAIGSRFVEFYKNRNDGKAIEKKALPKTTGILLGCYAVFPLLLAIYNWSIFGQPWMTGYDLSNEQFAFRWGQLKHNIPVLNKGLNYEALFFVFPLGIAGMLVVGPICESIMRLLWFAPIYFAYASYYWGPSGMAYLRFLICTFPVIIGSAFALIDHIFRGQGAIPPPKVTSLREKLSNLISPGRKVVAMMAVLIFIIAVRWSDTQRGLRSVVSDPGSRDLAKASHIASRILDDNVVIFSKRPIYCYLGTRRHFRLYDLRIFSTAYGKSAFPQNSIPRRQPIRTKRFHDFYQRLNDAQLLDKKRELVSSFLSQGRQVAYIIPRHAREGEQNKLCSDFSFSLLKEWDVSSPQAEKWGLYEVKFSR
ncbi:MAG: glycosyltransferase family 39 protein [Candidatus Poribacteria bacterium]